LRADEFANLGRIVPRECGGVFLAALLFECLNPNNPPTSSRPPRRDPYAEDSRSGNEVDAFCNNWRRGYGSRLKAGTTALGRSPDEQSDIRDFSPHVALLMRAAGYQRHCEERLRRGNPALPSLSWIASLALAMTNLDDWLFEI
jgi:hypothetical protein